MFTKLKTFFKKRLNPDEKYRLILTIGTLVTLGFTWFFFGIVQDIIGLDPLQRADLRVINLVALYRTPRLNDFMLFITYLGRWQTIFLGLTFVVIVLTLLKKWRIAATFVLSVAGGQLFVWIVKNVMDRPRPSLASSLVIENSFSFPSGHSFVAMTFYGFLTYLAIKFAKTKLQKIFVIVAGVGTILLIGFSRIYLGAHFPSDVLAGFAAGGAWLTAIITSLEIRNRFSPEGTQEPYWNKNRIFVLGLIFFIIWSGFVFYYYQTHSLKNIKINQSIVELNSNQVPVNLFDNLPKTSETITGRPMEPINIVIVGTKDQLEKAFEEAGWKQTDPVNIRTSVRLGYDSLFAKPYPAAPGTPSFWDFRPNDFAFEKATVSNPRQRFHIHFWQTNITVNNVPVWFATAHFDKSIVFKDYIIPTHEIDPNIDAEREKVKNDLGSTGSIVKLEEFQLLPAEKGKNAAGSLFFTDGKAELIYLR